MRCLRILTALSLAASPAAAAAPEWRQAREYEVLLSSYDIAPATINLKAGQPVRLRVVNNSGQEHSFYAKAFFSAAQVRANDAQGIVDGRLTVGPGRTREVTLVPAPGRYRARSSNRLHQLLGMRGDIVVE